MRRLGVLVIVLAVVSPLAPLRAGMVEDTLGPSEPRREFEKGFVEYLPIDRQSESTLSSWDDPHVGGWGGVLPGDIDGDDECVRRPRLRPVVFVHGTTEDAWFWRAAENDATVDVRERFLAAGWCPDQLWAISYTGGKGYFTYNDINADEVAEFIDAVRRYTRAPKVDVVTHSLGVTVFRKAAFEHPKLYRRVANVVAIAGANEGVTTCRGLGTAQGSEVCIELEPGSEWLAELNSIGQTPRGPSYLALYDPVGDQFYQGPDARSPRLEGGCNHEMPGAFHNGLARGPLAVSTYIPFLQGGQLPACHP
ncbi:MAG TPA: alpha/beta fold hydrolase [Acidimicrobiales bacterium]|nr:alpha/beta fold hydrolase [Acidimicrobiales bacterium]